MTSRPPSASGSPRPSTTPRSTGYVHIDVCERRLAQGKLFLFLAIDRVSKFTHVAFLDADTKTNGAAFLREVVAAFPYRLHTVLTDNGMALSPSCPSTGTGRRRGGWGTSSIASAASTASSTGWPSPTIPNRRVKEATVKAFHYPDLDALEAHVIAFVRACNVAKQLKWLRWRTPF